MPDIQLVAEPGREHGSRPSRRLRHVGKIPAVVYGHGIEPIPVTVDARELRVALNGEAGTRALLELHIGSDTHLAVARQLQRHPVRHTVVHVDFQVVSRDEVISADIPILLLGEAIAVHRGDGTVAQDLQALTVKARPADLPTSIEVDVSGLEIGHSIRVGDISLPRGVETDVDLEQVVVVGQPPRGPAAGEVPEGAEGEAAEGAAPAAAGEGAEGSAGESAGES